MSKILLIFTGIFTVINIIATTITVINTLKGANKNEKE